jgi:hypothetical protein
LKARQLVVLIYFGGTSAGCVGIFSELAVRQLNMGA